MKQIDHFKLTHVTLAMYFLIPEKFTGPIKQHYRSQDSVGRRRPGGPELPKFL